MFCNRFKYVNVIMKEEYKYNENKGGYDLWW